MTPALKLSTLQSQGRSLRTSGATQPGVPHLVKILLGLASSSASPKSASTIQFIIFSTCYESTSFRIRFSGFMSRCIIPFYCKSNYITTFTVQGLKQLNYYLVNLLLLVLLYIFTCFSLQFPSFIMLSNNSPPFKRSITKYMWCYPSYISYNLIILG